MMKKLMIAVAAAFIMTAAAAVALADYPAVEISGIPTFGQRKTYTIPLEINPRGISVDVSVEGAYADCGIDCIAMIEGWVKGYPSEDTRVYHAVMAARNPNVDWANCTRDPCYDNTVWVQPFPITGYHDAYSMTPEDVYAQLRNGNPVMVHRKYTIGGYEHWVVIYGYDGSSTAINWTGFKTMSPTYAASRVNYEHLSDLVSDWSGLNGFMYRTSGLPNLPASEPSVSFSPWSNDAYTGIEATNARIGQEILVYGGTCTETGMYLYDANGNYLSRISQSDYYYRIYFDINGEMHYTLTPATTYKYRFYAVMNGKTFWSGMYSFTTLGEPTVTVSFADWENSNFTYIGTTDAGIGQEITFSGGTCTETGMYLYDSGETFLAEASQNEYYYRIYFKINEELHYTLKPDTLYKYAFYAVINGNYYWSEMKSFRTNKGSVSFLPWENGNYTFIGTTNAAIGQEINITDGRTCTETGMHLYDNTGNFLAEARQNEYYYRIYFNINDECHYTLQPGIQYTYRFFAVVDGSTYWSDLQSFRTGGSSFVITYDANGGYNAPAEQWVSESAKTVVLSASVPARGGYSFLGWAEDPTASSAAYQPGAVYEGRQSVTLYAVWGPETTVDIYWQNVYCLASRRSAFIAFSVASSQTGAFSQVGLKVWNSSGTLIAEKTDSVSDAVQRVPAWYELYSETGVLLEEGTEYSYRLTATFNGRQYESPVMVFITEQAGDRHFGIDVSQAQGVIDWDTAAGYIDFAIIRCGFGGDYSANDDTKWLANAQACERLGIPYGVYLYSYAENEEEALGEAEHVLRLLSGRNPSLPVYYDLEDESTVGSLSGEQIIRQTEAFAGRIRRAGYKVGVYSNAAWWNGRLSDMQIANESIWFAAWSGAYASQGVSRALWQFTSDGSVPGISGRVDMNWSERFQFGTIGTTELPEDEEPDFILPDSVEVIEEEAFMNCDFKYVRLSVNTVRIGDRAFAGCAELRHIFIPENTTSISLSAFEDTVDLTIHGAAGSYAEFYAQKNGYGFAAADD